MEFEIKEKRDEEPHLDPLDLFYILILKAQPLKNHNNFAYFQCELY